MSRPALSIGAVVVRVRDLDVMSAFWSAALGYRPRYPRQEDWVALGPPGGGINLSFDLRRSEYGLPPRFHLDLYAVDQAAEVARLVALGACEVEVPRRPADADWRLLEDPEGNRFDVVQLPEDGEPT